MSDKLKEQALRALCLTRDYVGAKLLPSIKGWEWYDSGLALAESMPDSEWSKQFYLRVNEENYTTNEQPKQEEIGDIVKNTAENVFAYIIEHGELIPEEKCVEMLYFFLRDKRYRECGLENYKIVKGERMHEDNRPFCDLCQTRHHAKDCPKLKHKKLMKKYRGKSCAKFHIQNQDKDDICPTCGECINDNF